MDPNQASQKVWLDRDTNCLLVDKDLKHLHVLHSDICSEKNFPN